MNSINGWILLHAEAATWIPFLTVAALAFLLLVVPDWITKWLDRRQARRGTWTTPPGTSHHTIDALAAADTIPQGWRWTIDDCGCAWRRWPADMRVCPTHAAQNEEIIALLRGELSENGHPT